MADRTHKLILHALIALGVALTANLFLYCWRMLLPLGFGVTWPLLIAYFFATMVVQGWFVWYLYCQFQKREVGRASPGLSVDVFVPAYDEPAWIVERALRAARDITYPHATYLLDDSPAGRYADLAERLGVERLRRDANVAHKAGNINAALPRTRGEFIAIFDVDHAPSADFLDRTLPPFADPRLGFVQAMQTFCNSGDSPIAEAASQTAMEYFNITAVCNDRIGACSHHGSNAVFRRASLEDIGGYQPGLAEDLETSLAVHARGWGSAYVCEPLAPGLAPVDFQAFVIQQLKWSRGVFAAATTALRSGTFFRLTWQQKLSYSVRFSYYTLGLLFLLSMLQVLLHLFRTDVQAFEGSLARALPLIVVGTLIRWLMLRTHGTEPDARKGRCAKGISLAVAVWPVYVLSLVCAVLRVRIPFMSTPKMASSATELWTILPQVVMIAALAGGVAWKVVHWQGQPAPWTVFFALLLIAQQWILVVPIRRWWRESTAMGLAEAASESDVSDGTEIPAKLGQGSRTTPRS